MTEKYGLSAAVIKKVQSAFARFAAIDQVVLYGSRAKGNYRTGSDIDLTLKVTGNHPENLLADVTAALDELDLIYSFDVSIYNHIKNQKLLDHINRVGVIFYESGSNLNQ